MQSVAELGNDWELEKGGGQGQEWRRSTGQPSAGRMSCIVVPRALTWGFGFIRQDVPSS